MRRRSGHQLHRQPLDRRLEFRYPQLGVEMPTGYSIIDPRTVRTPDGQAHDVLDAIEALRGRPSSAR